VLRSESRSEDYGYLKQQLVQGDHLAVQNDITRAQLLPDPIAELSDRRRRLPRFDFNWQSWPVRYSTHGIRCTSARTVTRGPRTGRGYSTGTIGSISGSAVRKFSYAAMRRRRTSATSSPGKKGLRSSRPGTNDGCKP
jgi:hypothetical protein